MDPTTITRPDSISPASTPSEAPPADAAYTRLLTRPVTLTVAEWRTLARIATDLKSLEGRSGGEARWLGRAVSAALAEHQHNSETPEATTAGERMVMVEPPAPDETLTAFTDGACSGNPGPGGWGVVLVVKEQDGATRTEELSGGDPATTNNRMELTAAIRALEAVPDGTALSVVTDSKYLCDGMTRWLESWKRRGWQNSNRKSVKNRELWEQLDALAQEHTVAWKWIKGHAGDEHNERADVLAAQAIPNQEGR